MISKNCIHDPMRFGSSLVHQIGRTHCTAGMVIAEHTQLNYLELTVATGGKGVNMTDGIAVPIGAGDVYVSFAGDFHAIVSDDREPLRYDFITVQTEDRELSEALEKIVETHHDARSRVIRDERISSLVSSAISEMNGDKEHSDKIMGAVITQLLVCLIRAMSSHEGAAHIEGSSEADVICFKVMNYIDNHIYTMRGLDELCRVTRYSYNYLSNLFRATTGSTLREYFKNRRLETARLLLASGEFTVTRTAELLGYSSVYSLSTAFKKQFGVSPTSVRSCDNNL